MVRIDDNTGCPVIGGANDRLQVYDATNTTLLNIGCVNLGRNATSRPTRPSMRRWLATADRIGTSYVTLGTQTSGTVATHATNRSSTWRTSASAFDEAGNAVTAASIAEGGGNDVNF